ELLLFVAARAELVSTVLRPTLQQGICVVADRYADSTVAYQGYGRRLDLETIAFLNEFATEGLKPHVTFLLDLPAEESLRRSADKVPLALGGTLTRLSREIEEGQRRFEKSSLAFHQRVRQGYRKLAAADRTRWCLLDATQPLEAVSVAIWERMQQAFKAPK
ncbi:MAG: dTMP kinase, partial [Chloroflexi bacterium]|nr:dTMP kinase [Chloroflexota bacterium]